MESIREKVVAALDELAYNIPISASCIFAWGEVEVPECLRKDMEKDILMDLKFNY